MKQFFIIYNPRSSRFLDVKKEVLDKTTEIKGYLVGKFEVKKTSLEDNVEQFSKLLKNGDIVLSAGGDATASIAINAILSSKKDVSLAVLPYGNFNDLSRTLKTKKFNDVLKNIDKPKKLYPLDIVVDEKHFRYATCYVTIGMTAEAVKIFDQPAIRKRLKTKFGRSFGSYFNLSKWYFKNRHKKQFIPVFILNGQLKSKKTTDYVAVNGKSMARVMKGGEDYKKPRIFRSKTARLASFWRLFKFMTVSILSHVPGTETKGDVIDFPSPAEVEIQAEGENKSFKGIEKIEIKKSDKWIKVIQN